MPIWSGAPGDAPELTDLAEKLDSLSATELVLLGLGITLVALISHPLQVPLVRLFEGYWQRPPLRWVETAAKRRQQKRWDALARRIEMPGGATADRILDAQLASWAWTRQFPERRCDCLPTALGNTLRAAEDRAGVPYGFTAVVAWPRLYPLLSPDMRMVVDDRRDGVDLAVRLSATAYTATLATVALLAQHGFWMAVAAVPATLAWVAYRAAVAAATSYGEALHVAFDLHHFDLLQALRLELPKTLRDEREIGEALSDFCARESTMS